MAAVSQKAKDNRKAYFRNWYITNKVRISALAKDWYLKNRERILARQIELGHQRRNRYKRLYGITEQDYEQLLSEQFGGCAICRTHVIDKTGRRKYWCVDHCHVTGKVRGLLCVKCNIFLGHFEKRRELVLAYLDKA